MRPVFLSFAGLFFVLGVLGFFLPLLPGTPFLLLTSWCLVRSSPALDEKLHRSRLFGPLLRDWERHRALRLHVKVAALSAVALAVTLSLVFSDLSPTATVVFLVLAALGVTVILWIPTLRADQEQ